MADTEETAFRIMRGAIAGAVATFAMNQVLSLLESRQKDKLKISEAFCDKKPAEQVLVDRMNERFGWGLSKRRRQKAARGVKWALGIGTGVANAWVRRRVGAADN